MGEKQQKLVSKGALWIFILTMTGLCLCVGIPMIRLANDPEAFRAWVAGFGGWGRLLYVAVTALQVVVAFIPGEPLELAGGYAFGALEGTALALMGIVLGSALVFVLVRRFGAGLVEVFFPREKIDSVAFLRDPKRTRPIAFLLMLIPGTPKDFLSYFAGLTKLRLAEWLAIVAVARIPSVIGSAVSGGAAGSADYALAAWVMAATVLLSGVGLLYYRRICKAESGAK